MPDVATVLLHSPLVGPLTWQAVASELAGAGWPTAVPDLTPAMTGAGPYQPAFARAVAHQIDPWGQPVVLVGHSGAGPLLPRIVATLAVPVRALIYVDAGLPYPGQSWWEVVPTQLRTHLTDLRHGDQLPPWHEWFPESSLTQLLPDPSLRTRFTAELSPIPISYLHEPTALVDWSGPAGYLLLSDAYRDDARRAAQRGMPVAERIIDHLAPVSSPGVVAATLAQLLTALTPAAQQQRAS